jgi:hypothetical protein
MKNMIFSFGNAVGSRGNRKKTFLKPFMVVEEFTPQEAIYRENGQWRRALPETVEGIEALPCGVYVVYQTVAWVIARNRKQAMRLFNRHYFAAKPNYSHWKYDKKIEALIGKGLLVEDEVIGFYRLPHHTNQKLGFMGSSTAPDKNREELVRFLAENGCGDRLPYWRENGNIYMAWFRFEKE